MISIEHADGPQLAENVKRIIESAIVSRADEGALVVFQGELSVEVYADLMWTLGTSEGWEARTYLETYDEKRFVLLGVDVPVGHDAGNAVLSELVAFAPYDYLPTTRRAPVNAIAVRVKPELSGDPLPDRPARRGNLAAIKVDVPARAFDSLWTQSQALRQEMNGIDNTLVRARVTLPFPQDVWESQGRR